MKNCLSLVLLGLVLLVIGIEGTCKNIKQNDPHAPSGVYVITSCETGRFMNVYCEMGLNGGGYTFLSSRYLTLLSNKELQKMFTDRSSILMRFRRCNSSCIQPYIVLKQLSQYQDVPLKIGLNDFSGYARPKNIRFIEAPCLYYGFLPESMAMNSSVQGVWANGKDYPFETSTANANNYFALFPNYKEKQPTDYMFGKDFQWIQSVFESAKDNPSGRMLPQEYFYFMEQNFGVCPGVDQSDNGQPGVYTQATSNQVGGGYTQSDGRQQRSLKLSKAALAIGFR